MNMPKQDDCLLLEKVIETVDNVIIVMDRNGLIRRFNPAAESLTGYKAEDIVDHAHWSLLIPEEQRQAVEKTFASLTSGDFPNTMVNEWLTQDGQHVTIQWHNSAITDAYNQVQYVIATGTDITPQIQAHADLAISAKALETGEGLVITDKNGVIIRTNKVFTQFTGYSEEEAIGKTPSLLSSGKHDAKFYEAMWQGIAERGYWAGEIWNKRKNGEIYPEYLKVSAVYNDQHEVTHYVASFADISNLKNAEKKLQFFANYDLVTGLPNRSYFLKLLRTSLQQARTHHDQLILLHVRLNRLSKLNTQLGFEVTDKLRLLLNAGEHAQIEDLEESNAILHNLDPRIGICVFDGQPPADDNIQAETLLERGLLSSFEAIDQGRQVLFYSSESQQIADNSYKLEQALTHATQNMSEFELFHQPQYDQHHQITGGELLIRWKHNGSYIPPNVFIPFAEKSGLILKIGRWVLETAAQHYEQLKAHGLHRHYAQLGVNLSAKQLLSESFVDELEALLARHPGLVHHLTLEITETAFIDDIEAVKTRISRLRALGLRISIDDFGTGYASFSYLTELEFDEIKIDKTFTDMVHIVDHKSHKIAKAIIGIVKALNVSTIAEGVETKEQFDTLVGLHCKHFQGYYLSRPVPFAELV
ncbi:MAG: EAL domain-containing protein, partial [Thiotrichales bacterium]|nr:EAL domain-containing protein [Thiotrichales bacterium]